MADEIENDVPSTTDDAVPADNSADTAVDTASAVDNGNSPIIDSTDSGDTGDISSETDPSSDADVPSDDPTPEAPFPDDWREQMAGNDKKLLQTLKRYRSPQTFANSFANTQKLAREKAGPVKLSENPTDQELADYRKAYDIPEEATGYDVHFPEGVEASELDNELLDNFKSHMHDNNMPPDAVKSAFDWYNQHMQAVEQDRNEFMAVAQQEAADALQREWGSEYKSNLAAIQSFANDQLGDGADDLMNARLADGSRVGDNPDFLRLIAQPAVDYAGPNAIYGGDTADTAKTLSERKDEILQLKLSDPIKFKSDPVQQELSSIFQRLERVGG